MTWYLDNKPAPKRIENPECPVAIAPRDDGSWGIRMGNDPEIFGSFKSAGTAFDYATSRYTHVNPLQIEPAAPAAIPHATNSVRGILDKISS